MLCDIPTQNTLCEQAVCNITGSKNRKNVTVTWCVIRMRIIGIAGTFHNQQERVTFFTSLKP